MEEDKKNTSSAVEEVKADAPAPENTQEVKDEVKNEVNEKVNQSETAPTETTTAESNKDNDTNAASTQENNSTLSPIYSRWKSFSFSKVIENVKKQVSFYL